MELFEDDNLVSNMCFSYRHDFGLLRVDTQNEIKRQCREWLRAYLNNAKPEKLNNTSFIIPFNQGFEIRFLPAPLMERGKSLLLIHPDDMPKD